jgi:hypothetical protein
MSWDFQTITDIFVIMESIAIMLGVPIALWQYRRATEHERQVADHERRDTENSAYDSTDQAFRDYQKLCMENPKLDIFDVPDKKPKQLTPEEKKKEVIAFTMLFSVFERAHFIYDNYKSLTVSPVSRQWDAWEEYIEGFCKRDNFKQAWKVSGKTFDPKFQKYMEEKHNLE